MLKFWRKSPTERLRKLNQMLFDKTNDSNLVFLMSGEEGYILQRDERHQDGGGITIDISFDSYAQAKSYVKKMKPYRR